MTPVCPRCGTRHAGPSAWCAAIERHKQRVAAGICLPVHAKRQEPKHDNVDPAAAE